jgi:CDP-glucose 4,6-dehydratase
MLALNSNKALQQLGWKPQLALDPALMWTVSWYKHWHQGGNARQLTHEQINRFMEGPLQ